MFKTAPLVAHDHDIAFRIVGQPLRVGLAGSRVRSLGSVLNSESVPKQASESVSRVFKQRILKMPLETGAYTPGRPIMRPVSGHFLISRPTQKS